MQNDDDDDCRLVERSVFLHKSCSLRSMSCKRDTAKKEDVKAK